MVIERERGEKRAKSERERQNSKSRQVTPKRGWRVLAKEARRGAEHGEREERGELVPWREPEDETTEFQPTD